MAIRKHRLAVVIIWLCLTGIVWGTLSDYKIKGDFYLIGDEKKVFWYEGTNYLSFRAPSTLAADYDFTWPVDYGTSGQQLTSDGAGVLSWADPGGSGGAGDISDVGDCSNGAAFTADGSGNSLWFEGSTVDAVETILTVVDPTTSDKTITLPNFTGYAVIDATSCTDIEGTYLSISGGTLNVSDSWYDALGDISLTSAYIIVGNGSNVGAGVAMSGDVAIDNTGATSLQTNSVSDNEIDYSNVTLADFDYEGIWKVLYTDNLGDVTELALGASATYLRSQGTKNAPVFDEIDLGADTTGNYVATIADAGNSCITVANSGSESAAVTLDLTDGGIAEADLKAVDAAVDEDILTFESTTGDFEWHTVAQVLGLGALKDLSDVATFNPADNELLAYDTGSSTWIQQTMAEAGFGDLAPLDSVSTTEIADNTIQAVDLEATNTEADNDIVTYDSGTGGFTFNTPAELGIVSGAAGNDHEVQWNNSGAFGAEAAFTYNDGTNLLSVSGALDVDNIGIDGRTITWDSGPLYLKESGESAYLVLDYSSSNGAAVVLAAERAGDNAGLALTSDAGVDYVLIWGKDLHIDNDLKIGSASAGVDYTLTFDGENDDCVMTYDEDNNILGFGDTDITTTGDFTGGNAVLTQDLTVGDDVIISDGGYIGSVSAEDAIKIQADGDIEVAHTLYVTGNADVSSDVMCDEITIEAPAQDWKLTNKSTEKALAIAGQSANKNALIKVFSATGDAGDYCVVYLYGLGTTASTADAEYGFFGWHVANAQYEFSTYATTGETLRPLCFYTSGNTDQVELEADGDVIMATLPTFASGTALQIDAGNRLGTLSSALGYKKNIEDINDSDRLYNLRPVSFDANEPNGATNLYGLIAEEVATVMPELVRYKVDRIKATRPNPIDPNETETYIKEWRQTDIPDGVHYDRLIPLMLKEIQNLKAEVEELKKAK